MTNQKVPVTQMACMYNVTDGILRAPISFPRLITIRVFMFGHLMQVSHVNDLRRLLKIEVQHGFKSNS